MDPLEAGAALPPAVVRGPSAQSYLKLAWDYPVYTPPAPKESKGDTVAKVKRSALTREAAFKVIAGDDPRPLLVLRECKVCNGTDDALLKGGADNEKTFLIAQWFHCVKLPADVLEEDHPFHALFTEEAPEHLFVASIDGSNHDPLEAQTSRTELWDSMRDVIAREYKSKPDGSMKTLAKLLDKMDLADRAARDLATRQDEILENDGPKSKKLKKVAKKLAEAELKSDELHEEFARAAGKMTLKKKKPTAAAK